MLRPITCPHCKNCVGWYNTSSMTIAVPRPPDGMRVFIATLRCDKCSRVCSFDGKKLKRAEKQKPPSITDTIRSIVASVEGLAA